MGTTCELRAATSVPRPIQYTEMDLKNKTTSEFRTVFHSPVGDPNSQVLLYLAEGYAAEICHFASTFVPDKSVITNIFIIFAQIHLYKSLGHHNLIFIHWMVK